MLLHLKRSLKGRSYPIALRTALSIQVLVVVFFVADSISDYMADPTASHSFLEPIVTLALGFGVFMTGWQLRMTLNRLSDQNRTLDTARGELAKVIQAQFAGWKLTELLPNVWTVSGIN